MCGRFTLRATSAEMAEFFELFRVPDLTPRPNICPTQQIPAITLPIGGPRQCEMFRWGFIPGWSKSPLGGPPLINARAETVATKPTFRNAFKKQRCLIPASGFYEWRKVAGMKKKQPVLIAVREMPLLAFAGLWDSWHSADNETINSCTIITTQANSAVASVHDRMPVILAPETFAEWLDPSGETDLLSSLLHPYPAEEMVLSAEIADELLSEKPKSEQKELF